MSDKVIRRKFISIAQIQQINDATIVMRHFIDLSARLLPYLNELSVKELLQPHELKDRIKILEVFKQYNFETFTSEILMGSKILDTIFNTYEAVEKRIPGVETTADELLSKFEAELIDLNKNWSLTMLN